MKQIISILITVVFFHFNMDVKAQGCVAIRSTGGVCTMDHADQKTEKPASWSLNINNRYFKSFRHFVGTVEQKQRAELGNEVINHSYTMDITLTRNINKWWSYSIDVPILANSRSSWYEHDGKTRHLTHSFGLGDVRVTGYHWLFNPEKAGKGNIQFGLGIKLPTGDYKYTDAFYKNDTTNVTGPVDQSIQLGDGGTGISTELNTFYDFSKHLSVYGNFYYLINPREQNGTSTARGGTPSTSSIRYGSSSMSVPDQYMLRAGVNLTAKKLSATVGFRDECLPVHDIIGGSSGFRRPGYILSVEPGVTYTFKKMNLYAYVPVALKRNRTQSVPDKVQTAITGKYSQGDAAFADYTINVGMTFKF